jgi:hypothetical protein
MARLAGSMGWGRRPLFDLHALLAQVLIYEADEEIARFQRHLSAEQQIQVRRPALAVNFI